MLEASSTVWDVVSVSPLGSGIHISVGATYAHCLYASAVRFEEDFEEPQQESAKILHSRAR